MAAQDPLEDLRQRHQELLAAAGRRLDAVQSGRPLPPDLLLGEIAADLERAHARLGEAEAAKEAAVARYDETIGRRRREIADLEKRAEELRDELGGGGGGRPPRPVRPTPRPVGEIEGIGRVFAERLERAGIRDVSQLSALPAARLAEILETQEARAGELIERAKKLGGG